MPYLLDKVKYVGCPEEDLEILDLKATPSGTVYKKNEGRNFLAMYIRHGL
jgi:hypothetical protein